MPCARSARRSPRRWRGPAKPQAAILAVGALAPRALVRDGALVARHTMNVTLACDHRILYGADAAQFLARIRALLERPLALAFAD